MGHIPRGWGMNLMGVGSKNIRGRGALLAIGPPNEEKGGKAERYSLLKDVRENRLPCLQQESKNEVTSLH